MEQLPQLPEHLIQPVLLGVVGLIGLAACFAGFRLFRTLLVAIVALKVSLGMAYLGFSIGSDPMLWSIGGLVGGAILGAVFAWGFYKLAVGILGALFISSLVFPWVEPWSIGQQAAAIAVACFAGALLAMALADLTIQLGSAFLGAFLVVMAVRFFAFGEQTIEWAQADDSDHIVWLFHLPRSAALAVLALGAVGFIFQRSRVRN